MGGLHDSITDDRIMEAMEDLGSKSAATRRVSVWNFITFPFCSNPVWRRWIPPDERLTSMRRQAALIPAPALRSVCMILDARSASIGDDEALEKRESAPEEGPAARIHGEKRLPRD